MKNSSYVGDSAKNYVNNSKTTSISNNTSEISPNTSYVSMSSNSTTIAHIRIHSLLQQIEIFWGGSLSVCLSKGVNTFRIPQLIVWVINRFEQNYQNQCQTNKHFISLPPPYSREFKNFDWYSSLELVYAIYFRA